MFLLNEWVKQKESLLIRKHHIYQKAFIWVFNEFYVTLRSMFMEKTRIDHELFKGNFFSLLTFSGNLIPCGKLLQCKATSYHSRNNYCCLPPVYQVQTPLHLSLFAFTSTLWGEYYYYPDYLDEKVTCPGRHISEAVSGWAHGWGLRISTQTWSKGHTRRPDTVNPSPKAACFLCLLKIRTVILVVLIAILSRGFCIYLKL